MITHKTKKVAKFPWNSYQTLIEPRPPVLLQFVHNNWKYKSSIRSIKGRLHLLIFMSEL